MDSAGAEDGLADPHALTAWEVGLHGTDLMPDEVGLLPAGADVAAYVRVRSDSWRAGRLSRPGF